MTPDMMVAVGKQLLLALSDLDPSPMEEHFAEHVVFEWPYAAEGLPQTVNGKRNLINLLQGTANTFRSFTMEGDLFLPCESMETLVIEARSNGVLHSGEAYRNKYVQIMRFSEGKVVRWLEYYDPRLVSPFLQKSTSAG